MYYYHKNILFTLFTKLLQNKPVLHFFIVCIQVVYVWKLTQGSQILILVEFRKASSGASIPVQRRDPHPLPLLGCFYELGLSLTKLLVLYMDTGMATEVLVVAFI